MTIQRLFLDGPITRTPHILFSLKDGLPDLLKLGYEPMSAAHLMEQRTLMRQSGTPSVQRDSWWNTDFHTADLVLHHPDKGAKMIPYGSEVLQFLQKYKRTEEMCSTGSHGLPDGLYEAMNGLQLPIALHQKYTAQEARQSEIWKELAGRSQDRLDRYVDAVVAETGRQEGLMEIEIYKKVVVPTVRLWRLGSKETNFGGSCNNLGDTMVGVAQQVHVNSITSRKL